MQSVATIEIDEKGEVEVPKSCIGSARDARDTIATLVKAEGIRASRRAKVIGMWNRNPPWPGLLRAKGQAERANFCQGEFEGFVASAKSPYYALAFKAERFVQLTLDYGDASFDQLDTWAKKIATRYQYANDDDDTLDMHMQRSQCQMIVHGNGPMVWEDGEDWLATSRVAGQLLVPDDASADIDEWDTADSPKSYLPTELWRKIENEEAATARGWNVPAVKRAIMSAAPETIRTNFGLNFEYFEAEMRKGATGFDAKSKRIFTHFLYQKEFTNRISHFIVLKDDEGSVSNQPGEKATDDDFGFLFRKVGRFECWANIVCPFLYDVGNDGQWHSVKGAGPKIFDLYGASDRLFCRSLDGAMKAAGVLVQAKDGKSLETSAMEDVSGGTVISPGYEAQQQRIAPDLTSPLLMKREIRETVSRNTGAYEAHFMTDEHAPTLGQEQLNVQAQNVLGDFDASRYYKSLDRFHRERFRRLLAMGKKLFRSRKDVAPVDIENETSLTPSEKGALKFYRSCVVTDQIPEDVLEFENFCRIKATRLVGNGSAQMRTIIGKELVGVASASDERGRRFAFRSFVSAVAGETVADQMFPAYDTPPVVDQNISVATMENNFLAMPNAQVAVSPEQDHVTHFGIHFQFVGQSAQAVQAGQGDPRQLLILLEQAGPHTKQHLQEIEGDPTRKDQVDQMTKAWLGMSKMQDQLAQQVAEADKAAAAQQPAQQPDPATISALAKVHSDYQLGLQKQQGDFILKSRKQAFTLQQSDQKVAHKMRLENFEAARQPVGKAA